VRTIKPTGERRIVPLDEAVRRVEAAEKPKGTGTGSDIYEHGIDVMLSAVSCIDADGHVFEEYARIGIPRTSTAIGNIFDAASRRHTLGSRFLPSFALTANMIYKLAARKTPACEGILKLYKTQYHMTNTFIDFKIGYLLHYPEYTHFPEQYHNLNNAEKMNQGLKAKALPFNLGSLHSFEVAHLMKVPSFRKFMVQLTGMEWPERFVDVFNDYGRNRLEIKFDSVSQDYGVVLFNFKNGIYVTERMQEQKGAAKAVRLER